MFLIYPLGKVSGASSTLCNMMEMKIQMAIFLGGILVTGGFSSKLFQSDYRIIYDCYY